MRRTITTLLLAALPSFAAASTANADTPRCVSKHEYDRISIGMTMTKVHSIFDTKGAVTGLGGDTELRYYKTCSKNGLVQVGYNASGRVVSKSGNWFS